MGVEQNLDRIPTDLDPRIEIPLLRVLRAIPLVHRNFPTRIEKQESLGKPGEVTVVTGADEFDTEEVVAGVVIFAKTIDRFTTSALHPDARIFFPFGSSLLIGGIENGDHPQVTLYEDPFYTFGESDIVRGPFSSLSIDRRKLQYHLSMAQPDAEQVEKIRAKLRETKEEYFVKASRGGRLPEGMHFKANGDGIIRGRVDN